MYKHDIDISAMNLTELAHYLEEADRLAKEKIYNLVDETPRTAQELNKLAGSPYSGKARGGKVYHAVGWCEVEKKTVTKKFVEVDENDNPTGNYFFRLQQVNTYYRNK